MKAFLAAFVFTALGTAAIPARADGCYICEGSSTYVKYKGDETWDKRHKAEACGCKITGTTSSCGEAANQKILCSVSVIELPQNQSRAVSVSR